VESFAAIINPPESAILAVGKIVQKPVVVQGQLTARPMMTAIVSADHRVLDGVLVASFMNRVKEILERPYILLLSPDDASFGA
jgi:pyruvate dehydrogenase E2 component (dihydrolipoamide acetyltransferase)